MCALRYGNRTVGKTIARSWKYGRIRSPSKPMRWRRTRDNSARSFSPFPAACMMSVCTRRLTKCAGDCPTALVDGSWFGASEPVYSRAVAWVTSLCGGLAQYTLRREEPSGDPSAKRVRSMSTRLEVQHGRENGDGVHTLACHDPTRRGQALALPAHPGS